MPYISILKTLLFVDADQQKNRDQLAKEGESLRLRVHECRGKGHEPTEDLDKENLGLILKYLAHDAYHGHYEDFEQRRRTLHDILVTISLLSAYSRDGSEQQGIKDKDIYYVQHEGTNIWNDLEYLHNFCIPNNEMSYAKSLPITPKRLKNILEKDMYVVGKLVMAELKLFEGDKNEKIIQSLGKPRKLIHIFPLVRYWRSIEFLKVVFDCADEEVLQSINPGEFLGRQAIFIILKKIGEACTKKNSLSVVQSLAPEIDFEMLVDVRNKLAHLEWSMAHGVLFQDLGVINFDVILDEIRFIRERFIEAFSKFTFNAQLFYEQDKDGFDECINKLEIISAESFPENMMEELLEIIKEMYQKNYFDKVGKDYFVSLLKGDFLDFDEDEKLQEVLGEAIQKNPILKKQVFLDFIQTLQESFPEIYAEFKRLVEQSRDAKTLNEVVDSFVGSLVMQILEEQDIALDEQMKNIVSEDQDVFCQVCERIYDTLVRRKIISEIIAEKTKKNAGDIADKYKENRQQKKYEIAKLKREVIESIYQEPSAKQLAVSRVYWELKKLVKSHMDKKTPEQLGLCKKLRSVRTAIDKKQKNIKSQRSKNKTQQEKKQREYLPELFKLNEVLINSESYEKNKHLNVFMLEKFTLTLIDKLQGCFELLPSSALLQEMQFGFAGDRQMGFCVLSEIQQQSSIFSLWWERYAKYKAAVEKISEYIVESKSLSLDHSFVCILFFEPVLPHASYQKPLLAKNGVVFIGKYFEQNSCRIVEQTILLANQIKLANELKSNPVLNLAMVNLLSMISTCLKFLPRDYPLMSLAAMLEFKLQRNYIQHGNVYVNLEINDIESLFIRYASICLKEIGPRVRQLEEIRSKGYALLLSNVGMGWWRQSTHSFDPNTLEDLKNEPRNYFLQTG